MRKKAEILERLDLLQAMKDHPPVIIKSNEMWEPGNLDKHPGTISYYPKDAEIEVLVDIPAINAEIAALSWVLNGK